MFCVFFVGYFDILRIPCSLLIWVVWFCVWLLQFIDISSDFEWFFCEFVHFLCLECFWVTIWWVFHVMVYDFVQFCCDFDRFRVIICVIIGAFVQFHVFVAMSCEHVCFHVVLLELVWVLHSFVWFCAILLRFRGNSNDFIWLCVMSFDFVGNYGTYCGCDFLGFWWILMRFRRLF